MNGIMQGCRLLAAALMGVALLAPAQAGVVLQTLKENIFVCVSPEAYDNAMARVIELDGRNLEPLKKELSDARQCMFVDPEMVDNMEAPYAVIMERIGTKVQVQFIVTFRERIALLHRMMNRYVLVGWTDESNLEDREVL
jgi:hypothetical protein